VASAPSRDVAVVHDAPRKLTRSHSPGRISGNAATRLALWVGGWRPRDASLPTPIAHTAPNPIEALI
jgi:hypothetical protein